MMKEGIESDVSHGGSGIAESEDEDEATNNEESGEAAPRRQRQRVIAESEDEDGATNNEESGEAAPRRQRQRFLAGTVSRVQARQRAEMDRRVWRAMRRWAMLATVMCRWQHQPRSRAPSAHRRSPRQALSMSTAATTQTI